MSCRRPLLNRPSPMENAICPITGSADSTPFLSVPDRFHPEKGCRWNIVQINPSGLMMLNPRPDSEELEQHYQHSGYSPHMQSAHSPAERLQQAAHQLLLSWRAAVVLKGLNKEREETRLLEIGCATGTLLGTLHRKNGLQRKHLTGIEPDRESAAYARERYGLRILHALGELAENEKGYDRIVLWHTLEHIDDLHATLQEMERLLAPDGKIILALPNPFSYDAQHYGAYWAAWDAPRHLWHFTPDSLSALLALHGLTVSNTSQWLPDTIYNTLLSEKLLATGTRKPHGARNIPAALVQAGRFALRSVLNPTGSSSVIYTVQKTT
ncbi:MAG TPA: class I SAM-dependent methyltransferase [Chlorobium sp.]|nr:class I SAM-dependent methyltransferase [Chlorobium sp.]